MKPHGRRRGQRNSRAGRAVHQRAAGQRSRGMCVDAAGAHLPSGALGEGWLESLAILRGAERTAPRRRSANDDVAARARRVGDNAAQPVDVGRGHGVRGW